MKKTCFFKLLLILIYSSGKNGSSSVGSSGDMVLSLVVKGFLVVKDVFLVGFLVVLEGFAVVVVPEGFLDGVSKNYFPS